MKKSLLNGRRGWFIAGTAAVLLLGSAAVATASLDSEEPAPSSHSQPDDQNARAGDDDGGSDDGNADSTVPSATEVSASAAAEIALEEVPDGVVTSVDLENRRSDNPVWDVELVSPGYEHDIDVDATTGEVRGHERDDEDEDDWNEDSARAAAAISIADAEQAALAETASGSFVLEIDLEGSTNEPVWIVEVFSPSDETWKYIKIDGVSGSVIAVNGDYNDDDDWDDDDDDHDDDANDDDDDDDRDDHDDDD